MYSLNFYKYIFNLINIFIFQFNNQILIYFSKSNSFNTLFIKLYKIILLLNNLYISIFN